MYEISTTMVQPISWSIRRWVVHLLPVEMKKRAQKCSFNKISFNNSSLYGLNLCD